MIVMKKNIFKFILIFIFVYFIGIGSVYAADIDFEVGKYVSSDGKHSITISSDNTVKYDDTYSLTLNKKTNGDTITGKIGTNNISVTFYQLNSSSIILSTATSYSHDGSTFNLNDYTVFRLNSEPVVSNDGNFILLRNGSKVNAYADLQSAVDSAINNDVIKIDKAFTVYDGVYVANKNITIDGNNNNIKVDSWLNAFVVLDKNTKLNIVNFNIDGSAAGFEIDKSKVNIQTGTSTSIPIKKNSDSSDLKRVMPLINSKGELQVTNSKFTNFYISGSGSVLNILDGTLNVSKSLFDHNRATSKGGAIVLGRKITDSETNYPVTSVFIKDTEILNNYSSNGGALYIINVKEVNFDNSKLSNNTVTGGKGAAFLIDNQGIGGYYDVAEKLNLDLPILNIDSCEFVGNWVGNDGSAFEIHDASVNVDNTIFKQNVGIHSSSSCGCLSFYTEGLLKKNVVINNTVFEENMGSASVIGDHGSANISFDIRNTKFLKNKSVYNAFLMYSGDYYLENCLFDSEFASRTVIDFRPAVTPSDLNSGYKIPELVFKDVKFTNTNYNTTDILLRSYDASNKDIYPVNLTLEGNTEANIDIWNGNSLTIKGNHVGRINTDKNTPKDNIIIEENATVTELNINENKNLITIIVYDLEKIDGYNWQARKYIYLDNGTYNEKNIYLNHLLSEENHKLVLYTDSSYTNLWNFEVNGDMTLYGRWEEHTHSFNDYVVYENALYEQCDCGYLGKKLDLVAPDNLYENSNKKEVSIINELGIDENKIKLTYKKLVNNKWTDIEDIPSSVGNYKAVLTYENYEIEEEFTILKREVNPNTIDNITGMIISLIISICFIIIPVNLLKKRYN